MTWKIHGIIYIILSVVSLCSAQETTQSLQEGGGGGGGVRPRVRRKEGQGELKVRGSQTVFPTLERGRKQLCKRGVRITTAYTGQGRIQKKWSIFLCGSGSTTQYWLWIFIFELDAGLFQSSSSRRNVLQIYSIVGTTRRATELIKCIKIWIHNITEHSGES